MAHDEHDDDPLAMLADTAGHASIMVGQAQVIAALTEPDEPGNLQLLRRLLAIAADENGRVGMRATRDEVLEGRIGGWVALATLLAQEGLLRQTEGRLWFELGGFDDDPRAIFEIPPAREWLTLLFRVLPWLPVWLDPRMGLAVPMLAAVGAFERQGEHLATTEHWQATVLHCLNYGYALTCKLGHPDPGLGRAYLDAVGAGTDVPDGFFDGVEELAFEMNAAGVVLPEHPDPPDQREDTMADERSAPPSEAEMKGTRSKYSRKAKDAIAAALAGQEVRCYHLPVDLLFEPKVGVRWERGEAFDPLYDCLEQGGETFHMLADSGAPYFFMLASPGDRETMPGCETWVEVRWLDADALETSIQFWSTSGEFYAQLPFRFLLDADTLGGAAHRWALRRFLQFVAFDIFLVSFDEVGVLRYDGSAEVRLHEYKKEPLYDALADYLDVAEAGA